MCLGMQVICSGVTGMVIGIIVGIIGIIGCGVNYPMFSFTDSSLVTSLQSRQAPITADAAITKKQALFCHRQSKNSVEN